MFQPVVPLDGVAGWRFLERTEAAQRETFDKSAQIAREVAYFKENIAGIRTAEELVADRMLLKVALGAFGLDEEIDKKAFLERILAEGSEDPDALANRFVDPRYAEFSRAFGFGDFLGRRTGEPFFGDSITAKYRDRQFEIAVGAQSEPMRFALNFRREIAEYANDAANGQDAATQWFRVLGNSPLRAVFEKAFGLPSEFATIDIDKQREVLEDKTRALFGNDTLEVFLDAENIDTLINRYLVRAQVELGPSNSTRGAAALQLLQGAGVGTTNLLLSNLG